MARAYVIAWEYQVKPGAEEKFLAGYKADGDWVTLFRRAEGFIRTELARSEYDPRKFVTVDVWDSKSSFEKFAKQYATEYDALDAQFKDLTLHEHKVGSFYLE